MLAKPTVALGADEDEAAFMAKLAVITVPQKLDGHGQATKKKDKSTVVALS